MLPRTPPRAAATASQAPAVVSKSVKRAALIFLVGLLLMLIVLIVKPTGLFGAKERA